VVLIVTLITCLLIKHFICDFPLQAFPWMYKNKGIYGHMGGITHAAIHVFGTFLVFLFIAPLSACWLALLDGLLHYHIDYAKMNIGKKYNLLPNNSESFWVLLGLDQLLHQLTYVLLVLLYVYTHITLNL
jgi:Protein of unknown function (DUF3307)